MATPSYLIQARDASLNLQGEVGDWQQLDLVHRFNAPSSWALTFPPSSPVAATLAAPGAGIKITRNDVVILSGPVTRIERVWDAGTDSLVVSGVDDLIWLARRTARPEAPATTTATNEHDVRGPAVAETVLRQYVDVNAGPSALASRRVTGLTLAADGARGTTVTGRARFQNLLEFLAGLALSGGDLGFTIVQSGTSLEFRVYQPQDRSSTAVFSHDLGNLAGYSYVREAGAGNFAIVGGQGEGTARKFYEQGNSASIVHWGLSEFFLDRRDIPAAAVTELSQAATEELAARAQTTQLTLRPIDTDAATYLTDYAVGDRVKVLADDSTITDVVREVRIRYRQHEAEVITPTVGTAGASADVDVLWTNLLATLRRLAGLEARR